MRFQYPLKRYRNAEYIILVEETSNAKTRIYKASLVHALPIRLNYITNGELLKPFSAHSLLANHRTLLPNAVAGDELRISDSYPTSQSNRNSSQYGHINTSREVPDQPMCALRELNIR
jgi:hypothetical protein